MICPVEIANEMSAFGGVRWLLFVEAHEALLRSRSGAADSGEINLPVTLLVTVPQIPDGFDKDAIVTFDSPGLTTEVERAAGPFSGAEVIRLSRNTGQFSLVGTGIASQSIFDGTIIDLRLDGVLNPVPCV